MIFEAIERIKHMTTVMFALTVYGAILVALIFVLHGGWQ